MLYTYQGYFKNERFIPLEPIKIPDDIMVHVIIEKEALSIKTKSQRQGEALNKLLAALNIDEEHIDEEFDEILSQGISIREVDL